MKAYRIIYEDGVVTSGQDADSPVLSTRCSDNVRKGDFALSAYRSIWGHWYPDAFRDIRLNIPINGQEILEGNSDTKPAFLELAKKMTRRRRSLYGHMGIAFFNFSAGHVHLRALLREYVRLTTVVGPEIPFDRSPVVTLSFPECYAVLDAFMVSIKAYADSLRFLVWTILGSKQGTPRNLASLVKSHVPEELRCVIVRYVDGPLAELSGYRDNAVHYAPPGAHMSPCLLLSHDVIHAQVWLPENPVARSLKGFRYCQRDAFTYARSLLGSAYDFSNELFPILDTLQREKLRVARKEKQKKSNVASI
jgi:hypothetical protein